MYLFIFLRPSVKVTPFSRQVVLCGTEGGHNTSRTQTYSLSHPAVLAWTRAGLCWDSCLDDGHSPGVHRKLQVVLGCPCSPLPWSPPPTPTHRLLRHHFFFLLFFPPRQSRQAFKRIRSWGCCSSRMFSWLLDLRAETKGINLYAALRSECISYLLL